MSSSQEVQLQFNSYVHEMGYLIPTVRSPASLELTRVDFHWPPPAISDSESPRGCQMGREAQGLGEHLISHFAEQL